MDVAASLPTSAIAWCILQDFSVGAGTRRGAIHIHANVHAAWRALGATWPLPVLTATFRPFPPRSADSLEPAHAVFVAAEFPCHLDSGTCEQLLHFSRDELSRMGMKPSGNLA